MNREIKSNYSFGLGAVLRGVYRQLIPKEHKLRIENHEEEKVTPHKISKTNIDEKFKEIKSSSSIGMGSKKRVYKGSKSKKRHRPRFKQDIKNEKTNF